MLAAQIFKANDIRGIVGQELDEAGARALGQAYAVVTDQPQIVVGRDMRQSAPGLQAAFVDGVTAGGVSVIDIGLASTDGLWFASGWLDRPGVQITSSHNPGPYNGLKFCRRGAQPVEPAWLTALADLACQIDAGATTIEPAAVRGEVEARDLLPDYADYLWHLVPLDGGRRLKVVIDAGNGMAGYTVPAVLGPLDLDIVALYFDLDGTFPNHPPNPLEPANLLDARAAVARSGADLGIVFDGDADRAFIIDQHGQPVSPSAITAMIAVAELAKEPGATIVVNTITSSGAHQIVTEHGGQVVESRVGHTYMKAAMAQHNAIFGGEHSGHYYFRDFFGADSGMLAALYVLSALGHASVPLSDLVAQYDRYPSSGEINRTVADVADCLDRVATRFADRGQTVRGDGIKISGPDWWVSLRPSNTEPLLRLNVEAATAGEVADLRDEVLSLIEEA